jgi:hypothetical protein
MATLNNDHDLVNVEGKYRIYFNKEVVTNDQQTNTSYVAKELMF